MFAPMVAVINSVQLISPEPSVSAAYNIFMRPSALSLPFMPLLISSSERLPSPLTSRLINNSFNSLISSDETCTEMAVSAAFFKSLFYQKFLKLSKPLPSKLMFDFCLMCFFIHLCCNASSAVNLFSGLHIKAFINYLASLEIVSHSSPSNSTRPLRIDWQSSQSSSPSKGGYPHSRMQSMHPTDHMSQSIL